MNRDARLSSVPFNQLPSDDNDKDTSVLTVPQARSIQWAAIAGAVLTFISAVGLIAVRFAATASTTLFPKITTSLRTAAVGSDGLPAAALVIETGVDVVVLWFIVTLMAFFAFVIALVQHENDVIQASYGSSSYVWALSALWHALALALTAVVAGVSDILTLVVLFGLVLGWVFVFWYSNLLTTAGYRAYLNAAGIGFAWVPYASAVFLHLFYLSVVWVSLGFMHSGANAAPSALLVGPIVVPILYLVLAVIEAFRLFGWGLSSNYSHHLALYVFNIVFVIVAAWATVLSFSGDGITTA